MEGEQRHENQRQKGRREQVVLHKMYCTTGGVARNRARGSASGRAKVGFFLGMVDDTNFVSEVVFFFLRAFFLRAWAPDHAEHQQRKTKQSRSYSINGNETHAIMSTGAERER